MSPPVIDAGIDWATNHERADGTRPIDDPAVRERLIRAQIDVEVCRGFAYHRADLANEGAMFGVEGSMTKLFASETFKRHCREIHDMMGAEGLVTLESPEAHRGGLIEEALRHPRSPPSTAAPARSTATWLPRASSASSGSLSDQPTGSAPARLERRVFNVRQDVLGDEVALCGVGVPREDEGLNPHLLVRLELGHNLFRIPNDRRTGTGSRSPNTRPEVGFGVTVVVRTFPQFVLTGHASRLGVERLVPDLLTGVDVELRQESVGGGSRFSFGHRTIMWARRP